MEDSIDVKVYKRQNQLMAKKPRMVGSGKSEGLLEVGGTREVPLGTETFESSWRYKFRDLSKLPVARYS